MDENGEEVDDICNTAAKSESRRDRENGCRRNCVLLLVIEGRDYAKLSAQSETAGNL